MSDDLIRRLAAIDAMMKLQAEDEERYGCRIPEGFDGDRAKEALEQLPSIQPERKKGHWIFKAVSTNEYGVKEYKFVCSECDAAAYEFNQHYCHKCGKEMEIIA